MAPRVWLIGFVLFTLSWSVYGEPYVGALKQLQGSVLIDQGNGFISARTGAAVHLGDRLLLLENAQAALVQGNGCVLRLQENSLIIVTGSKSTSCTSLVTTVAGTVLAQAIGLEVNDADTMTDAVSGDGFGAIGADSEQMLTPQDIENARQEESISASEKASPESNVVTDSELSEEEPGVFEEQPVIAEEDPEFMLEEETTAEADSSLPQQSATKSIFAGGAVTVGAAVAGGIGLVAALAGGGGGGSGGGGGGSPSPQPLSPQ